MQIPACRDPYCSIWKDRAASAPSATLPLGFANTHCILPAIASACPTRRLLQSILYPRCPGWTNRAPRWFLPRPEVQLVAQPAAIVAPPLLPSARPQPASSRTRECRQCFPPAAYRKTGSTSPWTCARSRPATLVLRKCQPSLALRRPYDEIRRL